MSNNQTDSSRLEFLGVIDGSKWLRFFTYDKLKYSILDKNLNIVSVEIIYEDHFTRNAVPPEMILMSLELLIKTYGSNIIISSSKSIQIMYYPIEFLKILCLYDKQFNYSLLGKNVLELFSSEFKIENNSWFTFLSFDKINENTVEFIFNKCSEFEININPVILLLMHYAFPTNTYINYLLMGFLNKNPQFFSEKFLSNNYNIKWYFLKILFPPMIKLLLNGYINKIDISTLSQYDMPGYDTDYDFDHKYFLEIFDKYYPLITFPAKVFKSYIERNADICDHKFIIDLMIKYPEIIPDKITLRNIRNDNYIKMIDFFINNGHTTIIFNHDVICSMTYIYNEEIENIVIYAQDCNKLVISEDYTYLPMNNSARFNVYGIPKIMMLLEKLNYECNPNFFFKALHGLDKKIITKVINYFLHKCKNINLKNIITEYNFRLDTRILKSGDDDFITDRPKENNYESSSDDEI